MNLLVIYSSVSCSKICFIALVPKVQGVRAPMTECGLEGKIGRRS